MSKTESNGESFHSPQSQDTDPIESHGSDDLHITSSADNSQENSSLVVNASSLQHSLLDFPSPNESTTTACSTPHESKLASAMKRRLTRLSNESFTLKKQKLFPDDTLDDSDFRIGKESLSSVHPENDSTQEVSSSSLSDKTAEAKTVQRGEATYSSSVQRSTSSSTRSSLEGAMYLKQCLPFPPERNSLKKAYSEDPNGLESIETLRQRNLELSRELESVKRVLKIYQASKRMSLDRSGKRSGDEGEAVRNKQGSEKFICHLSYLHDNDGEVTSISIREFSKVDLVDHKHQRLSISSGSLADCSSSGSELNCAHRGPSIASYCSTSSSSSINSQQNKADNKFVVPHVPEVKRHTHLKYPKSCVCHCYCNTFIDAVTKLRSITPELSSSSDNIKTDSQDLTSASSESHEDIGLKAAPKEVAPVAVPKQSKITKAEGIEEKELTFCSRNSVYFPASTNLPVFAKWPNNSFCYPGVVEGGTEEAWHAGGHLEVKFCDGTTRKILSTNLFPAHLLPPGAEISYDKEDVLITAKLISVERLVNNELVFMGDQGVGGFPEIVKIPFEKIFLTNYHYKALKKESAASITPKKTPRCSISAANMTEGKRSRKLVRFSSITSKGSSSVSGRKTKVKKRGRATTTDSSGCESVKPEKKKKRVTSLKKSTQKSSGPSIETVATPQVESSKKQTVSRKLYPDTPRPQEADDRSVAGPSGVQLPRGAPSEPSRQIETSFSTDTDLDKEQHDVNMDEINGYNIDGEKVVNIPLRSFSTKSLTRKNNTGVIGPVPSTNIFSGFNFVLTHSEPKCNPVAKSSVSFDSFSDEGSGTDFEEYYNLPGVPFDFSYLKLQITSGGGKVYGFLMDVPKEEHGKTILISDKIVETPNYLVAISLGIRVYRHDLIIDACKQEKEVGKLMKESIQLPRGRDLMSGSWVEKSQVKGQPFAGLTAAVCLAANDSTSNFFWHLLTNSGATVFTSKDLLSLISGSPLSFILADEGIPEEVYCCALAHEVPIVTTVWLVQSLIHGKPREYDSHPQFSVVIHKSSSE